MTSQLYGPDFLLSLIFYMLPLLTQPGQVREMHSHGGCYGRPYDISLTVSPVYHNKGRRIQIHSVIAYLKVQVVSC